MNKTLLSLLLLVLTITFVKFNFSVSAQQPLQATEISPTPPTTGATGQCTLRIQDNDQLLINDLEAETIKIINDFYLALVDTLVTPDLNSKSLEYLFSLYRQYLTRLDDLADSLTSSLPATSPDFGNCQQYFRDKKSEMRKIFLNIYSQQLITKKGFLLTEKLDNINRSFNDLNESVRVTNQYMHKFSDFLPCFVKSCITR